VCTPATALGEVLVERLRAQGFVFDVERDERGPHADAWVGADTDPQRIA
jgi:hypothetical protein